MKNFTNLTINFDSNIKETLLKIESNNKGFLLAIDSEKKIVGTITDGDIRRQILSGASIYDPLKYIKNFTKLTYSDDFQTVCELFKSKKIEFLPIVDQFGKLINIVTKKQFQVFLLLDKKWDSNYDFSKIDESGIEYEIYNRPWGFYKTTLLTDFAQLKTVTIFPGEELSMQKHNKREEHWIVVKGNGKASIDNEKIDLFPGKYLYIPRFCRHQIINNSDENIVFSEVQLGDYFGEDDIIRYTDKYGRK